MAYYRFEAAKRGIYEAVELACPRSDARRTQKPDGSWLPRVGAKYLGAISLWTEVGLRKYFSSGLFAWHKSVLNDEVKILKTESVKNIFYEDEFQIICSQDQEFQQLTLEELSHF